MDTNKPNKLCSELMAGIAEAIVYAVAEHALGDFERDYACLDLANKVAADWAAANPKAKSQSIRMRVPQNRKRKLAAVMEVMETMDHDDPWYGSLLIVKQELEYSIRTGDTHLTTA